MDAAPRQAACAAQLAPDYHFIDGKCVVEIKPVAASKAAAIRAFLREPPFIGRAPFSATT